METVNACIGTEGVVFNGDADLAESVPNTWVCIWKQFRFLEDRGKSILSFHLKSSSTVYCKANFPICQNLRKMIWIHFLEFPTTYERSLPAVMCTVASLCGLYMAFHTYNGTAHILFQKESSFRLHHFKVLEIYSFFCVLCAF